MAAKIGVQVGTLERWEEKGEISPVQVRKLADKTHTPFGYLFLQHPPEERIPIADFRARRPDQHRHPSVELLDTISSMQQRQDWLHEELIRLGAFPCGLVGSFGTNSAIREAADVIRKEVDLAPDWAGNTASWSEARRQLIGAIETADVFVVVNGVVVNNTSRQLDPEEFLGFGLVDQYAPMIFVNGADFIASQNFSAGCTNSSTPASARPAFPPTSATGREVTRLNSSAIGSQPSTWCLQTAWRVHGILPDRMRACPARSRNSRGHSRSAKPLW